MVCTLVQSDPLALAEGRGPDTVTGTNVPAGRWGPEFCTSWKYLDEEANRGSLSFSRVVLDMQQLQLLAREMSV